MCVHAFVCVRDYVCVHVCVCVCVYAYFVVLEIKSHSPNKSEIYIIS